MRKLVLWKTMEQKTSHIVGHSISDTFHRGANLLLPLPPFLYLRSGIEFYHSRSTTVWFYCTLCTPVSFVPFCVALLHLSFGIPIFRCKLTSIYHVLIWLRLSLSPISISLFSFLSPFGLFRSLYNTVLRFGLNLRWPLPRSIGENHKPPITHKATHQRVKRYHVPGYR